MPQVHAVLDTCILFPAPIYSTLLYIAFHRVYQPIWTDLILEELRRTMLNDGHRSPDQVERRLHAMTASFEPGANLDRQGIAQRALIERMPNHPKDRHVLAAAVAIEADFLVTENRKDFKLIGTPYQEIAVVDADGFLLALLTVSRWHQLNILSALYAQVRDSHSLITLDALLERLVRHNGTTQFAAQIQSLSDDFVEWPAALVAAIIGGEFITEQALLGYGQ